MSLFRRHRFHVVCPSPWPIFAGICAVICIASFTASSYNLPYCITPLKWSFIGFCANLAMWWRDVIRETVFEQAHTHKVARGARTAFVFFILSEAMLFATFFVAYAYCGFSPSTEVGGVWPPTGIDFLPYEGVPLLNTFLLAISGASVTLAHRFVNRGNLYLGVICLFVTITLGLIFLHFQIHEYVNAPTDITDSAYGAAFFMITGLHGLHVFIGVCFLFNCAFRFTLNHYTRQHHAAFEMALWYWHFVDAVWLYVFVVLYMY